MYKAGDREFSVICSSMGICVMGEIVVIQGLFTLDKSGVEGVENKWCFTLEHFQHFEIAPGRDKLSLCEGSVI